MLDRLEADDEIEGSVGGRDLAAITGPKRDVHPGVPHRRVVDGLRVEIDPDGGLCDQRESGGPISLATGDVEHVFVARQFEYHRVAVEMLVVDLAAQFGDVALAGE